MLLQCLCCKAPKALPNEEALFLYVSTSENVGLNISHVRTESAKSLLSRAVFEAFTKNSAFFLAFVGS